VKKKLLISFSGGRTSGYMTWFILNEWEFRDQYDIVVVFANTGKEREETLLFVSNCDEILKFNTVWVEAQVIHGKRIGSVSRVVDYQRASRKGEPYEDVIKKYGIPNVKFLHCTRELKTNPIHHYVKSVLGWKNYYTAIGIRADEFDRMDENYKKKKYLYPLITYNITKKDVIDWWAKMPFDLTLKEHEGNCNKCFKKTLRKLLTIELEERENPFREPDNWWNEMENKYENHIPKTQKNRKGPIRFNRKNMTRQEIVELSKQPFDRFRDPNAVYDDEYLDVPGGCSESCEPF
jgi:hypothetical protein